MFAGRNSTGHRHRLYRVTGIQIDRHFGDAIHRQRIELGGLANRCLVGSFINTKGLGLVGVGKGLHPTHADGGVVGIHLLLGGGTTAIPA